MENFPKQSKSLRSVILSTMHVLFQMFFYTLDQFSFSPGVLLTSKIYNLISNKSFRL